MAVEEPRHLDVAPDKTNLLYPEELAASTLPPPSPPAAMVRGPDRAAARDRSAPMERLMCAIRVEPPCPRAQEPIERLALNRQPTARKGGTQKRMKRANQDTERLKRCTSPALRLLNLRSSSSARTLPRHCPWGRLSLFPLGRFDCSLGPHCSASGDYSKISPARRG